MRKIFTIAVREYRAMVGTKAFLFSMLMMPLLMFGGILAMEVLKNSGEIQDQKIIVIDHTGQLFAKLEASAKVLNAQLDLRDKKGSDDGDSFGQMSMSKRYILELWTGGAVSDEQLLELSDQIRKQELYAFIEIPEDVMDIDLKRLAETPPHLPTVRFYSEDSSLSEAKAWLGMEISRIAKEKRLLEANIEPEEVTKLSIPIPVKGLSLLEKSASGAISKGKEKEPLSAIFLPMGVMMLMFMVIFMASQPMLESVLEEKSQRIAEVLLGSANSYQLMTGKLLGTVGGSLTILVVYLLGGYGLAWYRGWTDQIPLELVPWFLVFQVFGVLLFASIFMAVGASVSQLKEAQSMLLPVWMLLMSPMFIWFMVIREPNGAMATWFSFFPPATSTMMMLRMSTDATIPAWQPVVGMLILALATMVCVYIAARIFRVGLLWQGKTPKLNELLRWAFRG